MYQIEENLKKEILGCADEELVQQLSNEDHSDLVFNNNLPKPVQQKLEDDYIKKNPKWYVTTQEIS